MKVFAVLLILTISVGVIGIGVYANQPNAVYLGIAFITATTTATLLEGRVKRPERKD